MECGAGDGETLSNTLFMERKLKWQGVLIEADRKFFSQILTRKRNVFALPVCLSLKPYPTEVSFYEDGLAGEIYGEKIPNQVDVTTNNNFKLANVQCFPLYSILLAVGRTQVDYFSVDVEGSESQILMNVPWHKVDIKVHKIKAYSNLKTNIPSKCILLYHQTLTVEVTSRSQVVVDTLTRYMEKQGYKKVGLMAGLGYYDLIFILNNTINV